MSESFAFNARQYFDFTEANSDQPDDTYFDLVVTENTETKVNDNVTERENSDPESDAFFSPMITEVSGATMQLKKNLRRSSSVGHLPTSPSTHNESLPNEVAVGVIKKAPSQECINRLAQPKRWTSHENLTLAEAVVKFQARTPKRFRSKATPPRKGSVVPWNITKGHTPQFKTKARIRPVTALSKEERERQELDEAKKFKIKAQPVNKNVFRGPLKPTVAVKPTTVVEPFNLKPVLRKTEVPQQEKVVFKAQPVPKSLNKPFKPLPGTYVPTRKQSTDLSKKPTNIASLETAMKTMQPFKPRPTEIQPFSFETRDKQLLKKKEEFINKVFEEEKRAREFHARPLPKTILRQKNTSEEQINEVGTSRPSVNRGQSNEEMSSTRFKAKPAVVLYKKPFEPRKDQHHHLKIEAFQFTTDDRLQARHKFVEKLKEKEAAQEAAKRARDEEARRLEEEEVALLRKQMEYKAQPIKKYKEVNIEHELKFTNPVSPKFHTDRIRNKENKENEAQ